MKPRPGIPVVLAWVLAAVAAAACEPGVETRALAALDEAGATVFECPASLRPAADDERLICAVVDGDASEFLSRWQAVWAADDAAGDLAAGPSENVHDVGGSRLTLRVRSGAVTVRCTARPATGATASAASDTTASPASGTIASSTTGATASPTSEAAASSTSEATAGPVSGTIATSTTGATASPTSDTTASPASEATAGPTTGATARPTLGATEGSGAAPSTFSTAGHEPGRPEPERAPGGVYAAPEMPAGDSPSPVGPKSAPPTKSLSVEALRGLDPAAAARRVLAATGVEVFDCPGGEAAALACGLFDGDFEAFAEAWGLVLARVGGRPVDDWSGTGPHVRHFDLAGGSASVRFNNGVVAVEAAGSGE